MATLLPLGDSRGSSRGGVEWWYLPSDFPQLSLAFEVLVSVAIESPSSLGVFCHVLFLHVVISFFPGEEHQWVDSWSSLL